MAFAEGGGNVKDDMIMKPYDESLNSQGGQTAAFL